MRQRLCIRCKEAPDGAEGTYFCGDCLIASRKKTTKKCPHCRIIYPRTKEFFYKEGYSKNGTSMFSSWCIPCIKSGPSRDKTNNRRRKRYAEDEQHRIKSRLVNRNRTSTRRIRVLTYYSGGPPKCSCCTESNLYFLTLDHINGGGGRQRKALNYWGTAFYFWIVKNNFPEGFQVLCANCHQGKTILGYCPHKPETFPSET